MALFDSILARAVDLRKSLPRVLPPKSSYRQQKDSFQGLLKKAKATRFGLHYDFEGILQSQNPMRTFQRTIPIFDYNKIYADWWHRSLKNEPDVCWPGTIKYFALSSGTSEATSKHIPISNEMLRSIKRTSVRQILSLANYDFPDSLLEKSFLMIGGSTDLNSRGSFHEGDLSGITARNIPFWFSRFYKPGKEIAGVRDWNEKIDIIARQAKEWDIGFIVGVPAWLQMIMQRVIEYNQVSNIHEIWPNLSVFVHGGVSFEPYRQGFEKLLGKPLCYIETYLASEGFIAYQNRPDTGAMQLVLNNGIFFEFIPFTDENFHSDGSLKENPKVLLIDEIQEGKEYALLLSTNAGAWRYLIGDTIRLINKPRSEIIITGRTKHFLSLCGEHLSVENMNAGIRHVAESLNVAIPEFTVSAESHGSMFAHHWYLGCDDALDALRAKELLDAFLCNINDDYCTERKAALKEVFLDVVPLRVFNEWMEKNGKMGGQHKFPRVMKGDRLEEWKRFVSESGIKMLSLAD